MPGRRRGGPSRKPGGQLEQRQLVAAPGGTSGMLPKLDRGEVVLAPRPRGRLTAPFTSVMTGFVPVSPVICLAESSCHNDAKNVTCVWTSHEHVLGGR
jgi:hypothetical protein